MNCFRRKAENSATSSYTYDDSGSLIKEKLDDGSEEDSDVPVVKFLLNEEIKQHLYSSDKTEEDIIKLFDDANPKTFQVNSCQFEGGNSLLHEVVIAGKIQVLNKLLDFGPEIDIKNKDGDTPLISILKTCKDCLHESTKENDSKEETTDESVGPSTAEKKRTCHKHYACLEILLKKEARLRVVKNKQKLSPLSYASMCYDEKREEYLKKLLHINEKVNLCSKLYQALETKSDSEFLEELNRIRSNIEDSKLNEFMFGDYTLLQVTCKHGMTESAKRLIELKLDINFAPIHHQRPIQLCCIFARPHILQMLLDAYKPDDIKSIKSKHDINLIHLTVKHIPDSENAHACLKILHEPTYKININEPDDYKRTPLHYAVIRDNDNCVVELLEHGALIDKEDLWRQTPLMNISESAMTKYLDKMVTDGKEEKAKKKNNSSSKKIHLDKQVTDGKKERAKKKKNGEEHRDKEQYMQLIFNFDPLFRKVKPSSDNDEEFFSFPTDLLCKIRNMKHLQKLIEHPIFSIIIHFKWEDIRIIFNLYLGMYFLFCILFTTYIYLSEDRPEEKVIPENVLLRAFYRHSKTLSAVTSLRMMIQHPTTVDVKIYFIIPICFFIFIFFILEYLKFLHNMPKYFRDMDNVVRFINFLLAISVMICLNTVPYSSFSSELKSFSVLMIWFELFLVIGKHPQFSFYVTIFRSASINLLKFISVHSVLLIGFALSFHVLFRTCDSKNPFTNPLNAVFKTIVMLTSEFDASDINFTIYQGFSHVIFIGYIFLTTIVLFNLMIAVAFKEVEHMEKNQFLYKSLAQINYIKHFEENFSKNLIIRNIHEFLSKCTWCKCMSRGKNKSETDGSGKKNVKFKLTVTIKERQKIFSKALVFRAYPEEKGELISISNNTTSKTDNASKNRSKFSSKTEWLTEKLNDYTNRIFNWFHHNLNDKVIENAQKIVSKQFSKNEELKEKTSVKALDSLRVELSELRKLIPQPTVEKQTLDSLRVGLSELRELVQQSIDEKQKATKPN